MVSLVVGEAVAQVIQVQACLEQFLAEKVEKVVEVMEQVQDQMSFIIKHHKLELMVQVVELVVELEEVLVVLT